jgi:RNA polymerase sigma-70 factor (ECF subfamily)
VPPNPNLLEKPGRTHREEQELIGRILAGERHLFHELVRPYERTVYLAALAILRHEADAEEAAQDAVIKAMTHLAQLREDTKFKNWLLQIATNEARMRRRRDRQVKFESLENTPPANEDGGFVPHEFADWREIPSDTLERKELRQALMRAVVTLPDMYREVFLLRDVEHLSGVEVAEALGVTTATVKVRLHRARLMMREQLAPIFKRRWSDALPFRKGIKPW